VIESSATLRAANMNIVLKWTLLVCLSAICSFAAAILSQFAKPAEIAGMLLGIVTFIAIYSAIEHWALKKNRALFLQSLKYGVIIKIFLQLVPAIELGAGWVAAMLIMGGTDGEKGFLTTYLMTITVGILLSAIVFLITSVCYYISRLRASRG